MENTQPVNASPVTNTSPDGLIDSGVSGTPVSGEDYSAILFVVTIPILIYFAGKYIYELTRPEPEQEPFIDKIIKLGKDIENAFKKIEEFPRIIENEINKLFDQVKNWVMGVVNTVKNGIMNFIQIVKSGIMDIVNTVIKWVKDLTQKLNCPFSILGHFDLCLGNYGGDVLLFILYGIVYFITFIIYCFFYTVCKGICIFTGQFCFPFDPSQLCPSRHNIGQAIDFISVKGGYRFFDTFQLTSGKTFFYRDRRNIETCYCSDPIIAAFDPLTTEFTMMKQPDLSAKSRAPIIIAVCLSFLFFYNKFVK